MRHFSMLLLLLSFPITSLGQVFAPTREVEATDDGIIVTYHFHGAYHQEDPLRAGARFWKIPGFDQNDIAGAPAIPFKWDMFAIPDDVDVLVEVLDSAYTDTLFTLAPAYPPLMISDTIGYNLQNVPDIEPYTGLYPRSATRLGHIRFYRGQGMVGVATMPVHYNCQTHTVRSFSMIKYMVSFMSNGNQVKGRNYVSATCHDNISYTDHFLENNTLNYSLSSNGLRNIGMRDGTQNSIPDNKGYLIITTNDFLDAVNEFAEWKRTKGFKVMVESKSKGQWTVNDIKDRIAYIYDQNQISNTPLYYLLIVGDNDFVPAESFSYHYVNTYQYVSDFYYGSLRYSTNDIYKGRVSVNTNQEASTILHKIMDYESNPPIDDNFYKDITTIAYYDDKGTYGHIHNFSYNYEQLDMVTTCELLNNFLTTSIDSSLVIHRLYKADNDANPLMWHNNQDSIPFFLRKPQYNWHVYPYDINTRFDNGSFFVLYKGHGSPTTWDSFDSYGADIQYLHNGNKTPVVFSQGCSNGKFDYNLVNINCFAESLLKKSNGGCVAIVAPTEKAFTDEESILNRRMLDSIWPGFVSYCDNDTLNGLSPNIPVYTLGEILNDGHVAMINRQIFDDEDHDPYIYNARIFHLFGDPSMMIYTAKPQEFPTPLISVRNDSVFVVITDGEDARISYHTPGKSLRGSFIGTIATFRMAYDNVIVCIDRHNYIPYIVTVSKENFIQNETISDTRIYTNSGTVKVGKNVTTTKPEGNVLIDGANVVIKGNTVELCPGTTITNSNVQINP